ncbi:5'-adenylylsulfate reductase 3, chloroplastic-like [Phoenix dactylifera]|uniref:5'-adenylylsulfate reductase 3, chloroplastic-like n=1 Tax=Phoenix dactylifera TaxID=42345 RepID=A0A8B7CM67_PHODC|nr:5'-adenylylsulfate reductase 3, chloroplastic-like [Phoenix dactylifera]
MLKTKSLLMTSAAAISSSISSHSFISCDARAALIGSMRHLAAPATMVEAVVEEKGKGREEEEEKANYDQLARELENASPLEIGDKALKKIWEWHRHCLQLGEYSNYFQIL